jgi:hypothetical protein
LGNVLKKVAVKTYDNYRSAGAEKEMSCVSIVSSNDNDPIKETCVESSQDPVDTFTAGYKEVALSNAKESNKQTVLDAAKSAAKGVKSSAQGILKKVLSFLK